MGKCKKILPYLIVLPFSFYLLPLAIKDTGSGMFILFIEIPAICGLVSLIIMLLFVPSIFIFYNKSAAIYILLYGAISLLGQCLGGSVGKDNKIRKFAVY